MQSLERDDVFAIPIWKPTPSNLLQNKAYLSGFPDALYYVKYDARLLVS